MNESNAEQSPVELLAEEFLDRQQRGEKPTIKEYCERHPELADEIRDVFEGLAMLEDLKPDSQSLLGDEMSIDGKRLERIGDYRILREIGRGGMGVVYEAEQEALGRRVALKVLPKSAAGDVKAVERFQREARAAARMHHTNIVPVFDVGQDEEHLFYAMQLIQGQGLDLVVDDLKRLREKSMVGGKSESRPEPVIAESLLTGRFHQENFDEGGCGTSSNVSASSDSTVTAAYKSDSSSSAVLPGQSELSSAESNRTAYYRSVTQIGLQTAGALSYAHARGIIHRDIKPANLLLDAAGVVWVTDFGLAKTGDSALTHTGDILGTIRYMSPERFRGQCDVRADLYALGLTLYEMLILKPAFASSDRLQLIEIIRHSEPPPLRSVDPRIPRDLETIVLKSIDKDPKRRYQSADDMAEDLERFLEDRPIKARRINVAERFWRWARRNKAIASLTAVLAAVLTVAAVASTITAIQFRNLAEQREKDRKQAVDARDSAQDERAKAMDATKVAEVAKEKLRRSLYFSDLNLVSALLEDGNSEQATKLLIKHYSEKHLHGFEYNYWLRAVSMHKEEFDPGPGPVGKLAISPKGEKLAVSSWWGAVFIIDARNNRIIKEIPYEPSQSPRGESRGAFSHDGKILVNAGPDNKVRRWDTQTGAPLPPAEVGCEITAGGAPLAVSSKHPIMAFAGAGDEVCLCNVDTGKLIAKLPRVGTSALRDLAFAPDGETLVAGYAGALARTRIVSIKPHKPAWEKVMATEKQSKLGRTAAINCVCYSLDGKLVITGGDDCVRLWHADTFQQIGILQTAEPVASLAFSADGKRLAAGTRQSNSILVWEMPSGTLIRTIRGHSRDVLGVCFAGFNSLWSSSSDGDVKNWDLNDCEPVKKATHPSVGRVMISCQSGRTNEVLFIDEQGVRRGNIGRIADLSWWRKDKQFSNWRSHDGYVSAWSKKGNLSMWKTDGTLVGEWTPSSGQSGTAAISKNGRKVAWAEDDGKSGPRIVIVDVFSQKRIELTDGFDQEKIDSLDFSPGGTRLVSRHHRQGFGSTPARLWDLSGAKPVVIEQFITSFDTVFSNDGASLAVAYWDNKIGIHDVKTGELQHILLGHANTVRCLAFSADDRTLVSGAEDGTVRVWDAKHGELRANLKGHVGSVNAVAMAPNGLWIASYGSNKQLRIWPAPLPVLNDTLTDHISQHLVQRGQWKEAAPLLRKLARAEFSLSWLPAAAVLALAKDKGQYSKYCQKVASYISANSPVEDHERAVKCALLMPNVAEVPKASLDILINRLDDNKIRRGLTSWLKATRALAYYRDELYQQARDTIPDTQGAQGTPSNRAFCLLIIALAEHKLHPDDKKAADALQEAANLIDHAMAQFKNGEMNGWHNWLYAEVIRREAEALINKK